MGHECLAGSIAAAPGCGISGACIGRATNPHRTAAATYHLPPPGDAPHAVRIRKEAAMDGSSRSDVHSVRQWIQRVISGSSAGHLVHRLDGVLLVASGRTCCEVAECFGVDRRTVERWVRAATSGGIDGLAEHCHGGRPAKLSAVQAQQVRLALQACPVVYGFADRQWTGKRLASHVSRLCGVDLSVRSCQRLIARSASTWVDRWPATTCGDSGSGVRARPVRRVGADRAPSGGELSISSTCVAAAGSLRPRSCTA